MAEAFVIQGSVDVDLNKVLRGLESLDKKVETTGNNTESFSKKVSNAGTKLVKVFKVLGAGVAAVGGAFAGLVLQGSRYDGEIQQTSFLINRLNNTTQDLIKTKEKEASKVAMTSKQYRDSAVSIATFMQSMGMTNTEIDKMLPKMVQLVADGAAFANIPIDEAMAAVSSAAVGNYEALGKLNIEMSDALINNSSYAKNLGKTTQKMTAAEKTQAIYNTMLERGGHLTGFAENESGSFAAQLNLLKTKIGEAAGEIGQTFLPFLTPLISKMGELADKVKAGSIEFKNIYDKTGNAKEALQGALDVMGLPEWSEFIDKVEDMKTKIEKIPEKLKEWEQPLVLIGIAIGTLTAAIAANLLIINAGTIAYETYCAVMIAWNVVTGIATGATSALATAINACIWPVTLVIIGIGILIGITYVLYKNWDEFSAWVVETWEKIKTKTGELVDSIVGWFQKLPGRIEEKINELKSKISTKWEEIKTTISEKVSSIIESVTTFFSELPGKVAQKIDDLKTKIAEKWEEIKTTISTKVSEIITAVLTFIDELPGKIGDKIGVILGYIIMFGLAVWNWITVELPAIIAGIVAWFASLPDKIKIWLTEAKNKIVTWGQEAWATATEKASAIINGIVSYFQELPGKIKTWLIEAKNKIVAWGQEAWAVATEKASAVINGIVSYFKELPTKIKTKLDEVITKISLWATNLVNDGKQAASDFADGIMQKVKDLPGKFVTLGKDIVEGVVKGIKNAKNWALEKVGEFFNGIVSGAKRTLGIESPSKVMRDEVGIWMARGVGTGFQEGEKQVKLDINKTLDNVVSFSNQNIQSTTFTSKLNEFIGRISNIITPTGPNPGINTTINFNGDINDPIENARKIDNLLRDMAAAF